MRRWNRSTWPAVSTMFWVPGVERVAVRADLDAELDSAVDPTVKVVPQRRSAPAPDSTWDGSLPSWRGSSTRALCRAVTTLTRFLCARLVGELDLAVGGREQRVVAAHADVVARVERAPALPDDDRAGEDLLPIAALRRRVAAVAVTPVLAGCRPSCVPFLLLLGRSRPWPSPRAACASASRLRL